jgi:hypothetical protein
VYDERPIGPYMQTPATRSASDGISRERAAIGRRLGIASLCALTAIACESPTPPEVPLAHIAATKARYQPDDSIVVTVHNLTSVALVYSSCTAVLERLDGRSWTRVTGTGNCGDSGRLLQGGSTDTVFAMLGTPDRHLPSTMADGTYRCVFTEIGRLTDTKVGTASSASFLVSSKAL